MIVTLQNPDKISTGVQANIKIFDANGNIFNNVSGLSTAEQSVQISFNELITAGSASMNFSKGVPSQLSIYGSLDNENWTSLYSHIYNYTVSNVFTCKFENIEPFSHFKFGSNCMIDSSEFNIQNIQLYTQQGEPLVPSETIIDLNNFTPPAQLVTSSKPWFSSPKSFTTSSDYNPTYTQTYISVDNINIISNTSSESGNLLSATLSSVYYVTVDNIYRGNYDINGVYSPSGAPVFGGGFNEDGSNVLGTFDQFGELLPPISPFNVNYDEFGNILRGYDEFGNIVNPGLTVSIENQSVVLAPVYGEWVEDIFPRVYPTVYSYSIDTTNVKTWVLLETTNDGRDWGYLDIRENWAPQNHVDLFYPTFGVINGLKLVVLQLQDGVTSPFTVSLKYYDFTGNCINQTKRMYRYSNIFGSYAGDYIDVTSNPCSITKYGFSSDGISTPDSWALIGSNDSFETFTTLSEVTDNTTQNVFITSMDDSGSYRDFKLIFTKGVANINNIFFIGPSGNYNLTPPSRHNITYPVVFPPVHVYPPQTITNQMYGNGQYSAIYNDVTPDRIGLYDVTQPGGSVFLQFPTSIQITSYDSTSGFTIYGTNDQIIFTPIDITNSSGAPSYSKYLIVFNDIGFYSIQLFANVQFSPTEYSELAYWAVRDSFSTQFETNFTANLTTFSYFTSKGLIWTDGTNSVSSNGLTSNIISQSSLIVKDDYEIVSVSNTETSQTVSDIVIGTDAQEVIIYSRTLSEREMNGVIRYLKTKWDV